MYPEKAEHHRVNLTQLRDVIKELAEWIRFIIIFIWIHVLADCKHLPAAIASAEPLLSAPLLILSYYARLQSVYAVLNN